MTTMTLPRTRAAMVLAVIGGSLALWASAKVQVPFWPVPMTMQTFVVVALGMLLGARAGVAAVALYLAQGAMGLPVFAGPVGGLAYMAGPTGGFLLGFLIAAFVAGSIQTRNLLGQGAVALLAHAVLFVPGVLWLSTFVGLQQAFIAGAVPFVLATLLKASLNVAAARVVR